MAKSYLKGFAVLAKIGTDQEGSICSTSSTLTLTANTQDSTTKDDVEDGVLYPNEEVTSVSGTLKISGYQPATGDALTVTCGDTVSSCEFVTGSRKYTFAGIVSDLEYVGDKEGIASYDVTVKSKGKITKGTVSGS